MTMWLYFLWMFPLMILGAIFWIWMLVDLMKRKTGDKIAWVLVLIFLNVIGAILYFFLVHSKPHRKRR